MVGVCYDGVEGVLYLCLFSILAACAFTVMLCAIPRAWRQIACRSVHFQACLPAWAPSFSHSAPFSMYIPVYRLSQHIPKNTVIWSFVSIRRHSHRTQEMQYRKPFLWCAFPNFSLKGTRIRWHGWGGPVQPTGKEIRVSEPWPHQHAQLLQLQQQHGQPDQPAPARPGCLQCPNVWVHVSQKKNNLGGGAESDIRNLSHIRVTCLIFFCRNHTALFGGNPRYENVPLIGRGSPPPSVRWVPEAKSFLWCHFFLS